MWPVVKEQTACANYSPGEEAWSEKALSFHQLPLLWGRPDSSGTYFIFTFYLFHHVAWAGLELLDSNAAPPLASPVVRTIIHCCAQLFYWVLAWESLRYPRLALNSILPLFPPKCLQVWITIQVLFYCLKQMEPQLYVGAHLTVQERRRWLSAHSHMADWWYPVQTPWRAALALAWPWVKASCTWP